MIKLHTRKLNSALIGRLGGTVTSPRPYCPWFTPSQVAPPILGLLTLAHLQLIFKSLVLSLQLLQGILSIHYILGKQ